MPNVRAFTNIKQKVGKEPDKKWKGVTKGKNAPFEFVSGSSPAAQQTESPQEPMLPRPPMNIEQFVTPDYSGRDRFEKHVFEEIGFNPFGVDPNDAVKESNKQLPELFRHVFSGSVIWSDRHKLNKEQSDFWNDVVKQYHADTYNQAMTQKQAATEQYNFMMNQFDNSAREYKENLNKYRSKLKEFKEATRTKPTPREKAVSESRTAAEIAKEERIEKRKKEVKAQPRKATREDLISYSKYEDKVLEEIDEGGQIPPNQLRNLNRTRKAIGLPELTEKIVKGKKKKLLGIDVLWPDESDRYEYSEKAGGGNDEIVETRMYKGKKIVKYSDGRIEWAKD